LDENGGGGSEEKTVSELEKDLLLAFEEQENPSLAPAPSSPRPHRPSAEPLHPQIDREHDQSGRLEELRPSTPLRSQDQEEEPQEQQQRREVAVEAIREEGDDRDNEEREPQGESINAKGMKRSAATTATLKAAIAVTIQATRMTRIHDLQNGRSFPPHLPTTL
jgi:hypothetical protein